MGVFFCSWKLTILLTTYKWMNLERIHSWHQPFFFQQWFHHRNVGRSTNKDWERELPLLPLAQHISLFFSSLNKIISVFQQPLTYRIFHTYDISILLFYICISTHTQPRRVCLSLQVNTEHVLYYILSLMSPICFLLIKIQGQMRCKTSQNKLLP